VKNPKGKKLRRRREKFNYVNGDYNGVLWIQMIDLFHVGRNLLFIQVVSV